MAFNKLTLLVVLAFSLMGCATGSGQANLSDQNSQKAQQPPSGEKPADNQDISDTLLLMQMSSLLNAADAVNCGKMELAKEFKTLLHIFTDMQHELEKGQRPDKPKFMDANNRLTAARSQLNQASCEPPLPSLKTTDAYTDR